MPQSNNIQPGANHAVAVPSWAFKSDERKKFRRTKYKDKWSGEGVAKALRQVTVIKEKNDRSCEATARDGNASTTQPSLLYVRNKKSPEATQSAMSPRNTSTVSPTPSPSIYQCPETSSAVESAALPQSRDHGNALIYPHYVPLLKIKRPAGVLSIIIYI